MDEVATTDPRSQVFDVPDNLEAHVEFMNKKRMTINKLCQLSSKIGGVPEPQTGKAEAKTWLLDLELFMIWLETEVTISPALKERTKIHIALRLMFSHPNFHFEETTRDRARALHDRWEAQNWGQVIELSSDEDTNAAANDDNVASGSKRRKSSTSGATK